MERLEELITRLWWGGDPDERNPVSGMSRRDVHHVRKSWATIYADASGNGFQMFSRLFRTDPESKAFFEYIADASEEQMARDVTFRAHVLYIMAALNTAVELLPRPELVAPIMRKLGHSHHRKNIRRRHFYVFRDVLVSMLQEDLRLGEATVDSWGLFVAFMYQHIFTVVTD